MLESEYQDDFENGGSNPASSVDENAIQVATGGQGIASVTVTAPGSYASLPSLSTTGAGMGAALSPRMKAVDTVMSLPQDAMVIYDDEGVKVITHNIKREWKTIGNTNE